MLAAVMQQATTSDAEGGGALAILGIGLAIAIVALVGYWKVFTKLGLPGWMGIVPFVNVYQIFKARGQREPVLWLVLALIPCVSIVALWFLASDTAELFGKGIGWKLALFLLPGIGHLALGFGSAEVDRANLSSGVGLNAVGSA
jgi:hypothetical protein